jgi:hypothetical protein
MPKLGDAFGRPRNGLVTRGMVLLAYDGRRVGMTAKWADIGWGPEYWPSSVCAID